MREEKNRATTLPDYRKYGGMSPDREQVLLRAIRIGREAKEQLQQHTVRIEDIADAQRAVVAGEQSREELAESYLPLLAIIARRYSYGGSISTEDLIQEEAFGLLEAIDVCSKQRELNLAAVITVKAKNAVHRMIEQKRVLRFPSTTARAIRKVNYVSECLTKESGRDPKPEEIAEEMTIPPAIVRKLLIYIRTSSATSLDAPLSDDVDSSTLGEVYQTDEPTPQELLEQEDLCTQVRTVLKTLEPLEESTIRLRFGFVGGEVYTAEETAEELLLPLDEEQRMEIKALRKLRHPSRSSFLRDYL
ncbi:sigma-70 family RNA polymerase sigma factor [Oscillibacter sp.]|uniref:sigma-70 family RNA polymerase sigma factor n=1 Tax=Oscillibacter sp. TaxID=1945593 RepID=UPI002898199B|nr:sigma-70 family RNA polymerase sigma factor [Oscillibacter sp.]